MHLSEEDFDDDYQVSFSRFESMLKTNKVLFFDSEEFEEIILHYLDLGKPNLAKKALRLGLEQHPKSTGLKLVHVEMLVYEEKLDQADKLLNELFLIEPNNEEIYIQKATIFSKRENHDKAIEYLQKALEFTDDFADVYNLIGMEYLFMDNLEQAKINFIKCLEEDLEDQSALYNVVYCHEFLDQNQEAIDYLMTYIDLNPYSEIAWHQVGRLEYILKNYEASIRAFEFATYIDDEFIGAFMENGKALEKLKRYKEAIENYQKTIDLDDPTSYALLRIGKCNERLGNLDEALNFYNQTVHEDPLLDKGWIAITDFYVRQKNYKKAIFYVNKALEIDNQNKAYWKRYATINRTIGDLEGAEFGYRKAVEFGDGNLDTWLYWADALLLLKEYEMAILTLLQGLEFYPKSHEIEFRLAGIYYTMEQVRKGNFHLITAIKLNREGVMQFIEQFPRVFKSGKVSATIQKHL